jgi:hypothetical protein
MASGSTSATTRPPNFVRLQMAPDAPTVVMDTPEDAALRHLEAVPGLSQQALIIDLAARSQCHSP